MDIAAATKLADILSPKAEGEPVNAHVVERAVEPTPDFDRMQKVIQGRLVGDPIEPGTSRSGREG